MADRTTPSVRAVADRERTDPMRVANMGFLLDRLGADCAPLQFVRELTQNAIEAIDALGDRPSGAIVWDYDRKRYEQLGTYKVCVIDTGTGMTGPEMVKYINALSSSGRHQAVDRNYGVGAKIAAATRNHSGVIYLSWKDGNGSMIHLWRDPATGEYGLRQFRLPDAGYAYWATVSDEVKPPEIGAHGT